VKWHETNYQAYAQHLEQNRIDQALEAGRISSINIIQPATFDPKPVGPKIFVILGLGLVIGLIGAIGLPLVADSLDLPSRTLKMLRINWALASWLRFLDSRRNN
jgi:uncharacterized protein involved in exopolysaccharide biosynthesis